MSISKIIFLFMALRHFSFICQSLFIIFIYTSALFLANMNAFLSLEAFIGQFVIWFLEAESNKEPMVIRETLTTEINAGLNRKWHTVEKKEKESGYRTCLIQVLHFTPLRANC